jgi:glyoxylase-like metal-dependent hydrolase (beta-lactamase superfamily II)
MIRCVRAPNPSIYTGPGTNTYLLSSAGEVLIVDPGPVIDVHAAEIIAVLHREHLGTAVGVVATHTHPDHAPLANPLARSLGVPVYGYARGPSFDPDLTIGDGDEVPFGDEQLVAIHTPGHTPDHLCFRIDDVLLTGDHVMGGSSVIIEDAADYLESLYRVRDLAVHRIEPGHGDPMDDAAAAITEAIDHRLERERQIVRAVSDGATTIGDLVDVVYVGLPPALRAAAVHQMRVQLVKLSGDAAVWFDDDQTEQATVRPR